MPSGRPCRRQCRTEDRRCPDRRPTLAGQALGDHIPSLASAVGLDAVQALRLRVEFLGIDGRGIHAGGLGFTRFEQPVPLVSSENRRRADDEHHNNRESAHIEPSKLSHSTSIHD